MKNIIKTFGLSLMIVVVFFVYKSEVFGAFGDPFISLQVGTGPANGEILTTDGTNSSWVSNPSGAFPFTVQTGYNSTSTVIGFLGGLFSTASSTFSSNLFLSSLSQGYSFIGSNGIVKTVATSTLAGQVFPFTSQAWGNSTSTTLGFLNGFLSTASSTFSNDLRLSSLSQGYSFVGSGGIVKTVSTSTLASEVFTATTFSPNSIITTNSSGNLIATGTQLTVGNLIATTSAFSYFMGNVGIGTAGPNDKLEVSGGNGILITPSGGAARIAAGGIGLQMQGANPALLYQNTSAAANNKVWTGFETNTTQLFGRVLNDALNSAQNWITVTRSGATVSSVVFENGNVGIGTTGTGEKLEVAGNIQLPNTASIVLGSTWGSGVLSLLNGATTFATFGATGQQFNTGPLNFASGADYTLGTSDNYALAFKTNNSEKVRITTAGNVGIGTTTPVNKLDIAGGLGFFGTIPTLSSCGTSPAITKGSTDNSGKFTLGSVSTGCTLTFAVAKTNAPFCVLQSDAGLAFSKTVSVTAITIVNIGALSSTDISYICTQNNN